MPQKRISVVRKSKGFKRKDSIRESSPAMLIVCEGITEEIYFKSLRSQLNLKTTQIVIANNKKDSAPINLVKKAEELQHQDDGFEIIFCVFDKDQHQSFDSARAKIKKLSSQKKMSIPIYEAVSVPCFEFWILLHYKRTDMAFKSSREIIELLTKDQYIQHYRKCDYLLMLELMEKLEIALQNAIWLENQDYIENENPMTSVHKLVQKMKDFNSR